MPSRPTRSARPARTARPAEVLTARPAEVLSVDQARRIALAAQGFGDRRPAGAVDRRHGRRVFDRVQVIQIDSVNVVCRSQELPLFARLGHHRRDLIPNLTAAGDVFEYWGHEASHLPVSLHPLLRWRMDAARRGMHTWGGVARIAREQPEYVGRVFQQVEQRGPLTIGMLEDAGERRPGMWGWSPGKMALEYLFWSGQITARRGDNFERWYDLPENMLGAEILDLPTPPESEAKKELLLAAARAHGVGTARDLADYFRLRVPDARPLLAELVGEGRLDTVAVEGWRDPAFVLPGTVVPRRHRGRALLSPFDSLIWERDRTERLWGFRYRIEIYVPAAKRVHGYYVLPFLLDGDLVARVDLKADRAAGILRVRAAHVEERVAADGDRLARVCAELAAELGELATFLGLDAGVRVEPSGELAGPLARALDGSPGRVSAAGA